MNLKEQLAVIEAILFANGDPIASDKLADAACMEEEMLPRMIKQLSDRYENDGSALMILKLNNCYQLAVKTDYIDYVKKSMETKRSAPLSQAAMEVLTIIAYNQPVTKAFVEHIRGVDSSSVVNALVDKNLLKEAGRLDVPGKPIAYKTTSAFLRSFQLSSLEDLPALPNQDEQLSFDELLIENTETQSEAEGEA